MQSGDVAPNNQVLANFTVLDIFGSLGASLLLGFFLFVPGYVVGWVSNVLLFRERRPVTQLALSTPLGVAVVPILVYLLGRFPFVLWAMFVTVWLLFFGLIVRNGKTLSKKASPLLTRNVRIATCFALVWAVVAIASLVDLQFKNRLYFSVAAYDYSLRTAITAEAARTIPPANPFFASSPPVPLKYHYFWMLISSLPVRLAHLSPRHAMYGGTVWAGVILMSLVAISLRFFLRVRENIERKVLIGCGLLLVTGLDILGTVYLYVHFHSVTPDMEWWNEQITSWLDALLWTPHHIMCLVACMLGFLLLRAPAARRSERLVAITLAGFAFASAAGLSVLVTFTFALFVVLLLPFSILRRWYDDVLGLSAAGAIALLLALPFLRTLLSSSGASAGAPFAVISLRGFPLGVEVIAEIFKRNPQNLLFLCLPLLPLNYFLELGFFFIVGMWRIRAIRQDRIPMTRVEETAWLMVFTSFLVGTFLRSTTIGSNDLGWRCFLPAQFILLLWGALAVDEWWTSSRLPYSRLSYRLARVCMLLGILGTVYQAAMLRIYPVLHDDRRLDPQLFSWVYVEQNLGERTYALRSAYRKLDGLLSPNSIIQYNPETASFISHGIYANHEAAVGGTECASAFGGNSNTCALRLKEVLPLFLSPLPAQDVRVDDVCREYGISMLLVEKTDLAWARRNSWVWMRKPVVSNDYVRAFACGNSVQQAGLKPAP